MAELYLEMFEDYNIQRDDLQTSIDEGSAESYKKAREEMERLDEILGDKVEEEDDLIDKWERQLEAGEIPDLSEGLDRG